MKRFGFTIWEVLIACLVLTALTTICLQFFAAANDQWRLVFEQVAATQEAANLMERVRAAAWDNLNSQTAATLNLSPQAKKTLPEGRMEVKIDAPSGTPSARRVTVVVHWRPQPGTPEHEVRLTAWRYKNP